LPPLKPWIGDFDKMKERRLIHIIVPLSKTIYSLRGDPYALSLFLGVFRLALSASWS
jgi:hypothetical protein